MFVASTAEAVLQEMDNISSIRQNREVERLRMWTGDTEEVSDFVLYRLRQIEIDECRGTAEGPDVNMNDSSCFRKIWICTRG